jgi:small-conductance mechanosensitive channel
MSITDVKLPPNSVYVYCAPTPNQYWPLSLVVYQGVIAFAGIFFIFKTRNLFDELNESREVALMIYNLLFVGVIVIILLYLVTLGPYASYAIQAVGMLWIAGTTMLLLYLPKMYEFITGKSFHSSRESRLKSMGRGGQTRSEISRETNRTRIEHNSSIQTGQTSSD